MKYSNNFADADADNFARRVNKLVNDTTKMNEKNSFKSRKCRLGEKTYERKNKKSQRYVKNSHLF